MCGYCDYAFLHGLARWSPFKDIESEVVRKLTAAAGAGGVADDSGAVCKEYKNM